MKFEFSRINLLPNYVFAEINQLKAKLRKKGNDIIGEDSGDMSGYSISLSSNGEIIAIGSPYNDGNLEDSGSVRVFQYNEVNSSWVQLGNDIDGEAT